MDQGLHVYASTPGKVYETTDGAESWTLLNTTVPLGTCYTFKVRARAVSVLRNPTRTYHARLLISTFLTLLYSQNGTIGGEKYTLASCGKRSTNEWSERRK